MAIPYVSMKINTDARSFLRGCRGPPTFRMSLANDVANLAALGSWWQLDLEHIIVHDVPQGSS